MERKYSPNKNKFLKRIYPYLKKEFSCETKPLLREIKKEFLFLVSKNENESKALKTHSQQRIYPAIAVFRVLLSKGYSRNQAAEVIKHFYKEKASSGAKKIQRILKLPYLYKIVPRLASKKIEKTFNEAAGFSFKKYETTNEVFKLDMKKCPYFSICNRNDASEIVDAFCTADDIAYTNMHPRLLWKRKSTLARGGKICDFLIEINKK